jgi:hypothetical protein
MAVALLLIVGILWKVSWATDDVEVEHDVVATTEVDVVSPPPPPPRPPQGTELAEHNDDNHPSCESIAGRDRVVNDWKKDMRVVCDDPKSGIRIREFVQRSFEYKPQLFLFENVDVEYFNGNLLPNPCPVGTYFEEERSNEVQRWAQGEAVRVAYDTRKVRRITNRTIIRMRRFDVYNIYEAFHGYINTYFLIKVLDLDRTKVQFAFTDDDCGDSPKDAMMWNSINGGAFPIIYTKNHGQHNYGMVDGEPYRANVVRASSTGTSIICSNYGPLPGRSRDHHCKSSAFRAAVAWLRDNFGAAIKWSHVRPNPKVVVVWSSRRPYQRDIHYNAVPRQLPREDEFIAMLQGVLGPTYDVRNTDFGSMNPDNSIEAASNGDVMLGVHGAGLTWASFLPRHGGLVELFGGDRGEDNRHYHNIASLADLHYRSLSLNSLNWNAEHVHTIARIIREIPLHQADEPR